MAVLVGVAYQSTSSVTVRDESWVSLIGGPKTIAELTVLPLGSLVEIKGYVLDLSKHEAKVRIVIDGTEVIQGSPENPIMYVASFPAAELLVPHTVDFQAITIDCVETAFAGPVGFTVLNLIP